MRRLSKTQRRAVRALAHATAAGLLPLLCVSVAFAAPAIRNVSREQLRADAVQLQSLVSACAAQTKACDDAKVFSDERIGDPEKAGGFEVHWDSLRMTLSQAKTAKPDERATLLQAATLYLDEIAKDSGSEDQHAGEFQKARSLADDALSKPEFEGSDEPTWWERQKAKMFSWLQRIFEGLNRMGSSAPWLGPLLEWLLFMAAAGMLLFFLLRNLTRQRLRVALGEGAAKATAWDREATDWAKLAETRAAEHAWREAVHCLYWAAIVSLESRRAWSHNPTRTPREYVRLLKPGSAQRQGLQSLTQIFERVWYGLHEASGEEYGLTRALYDKLASHAAESTTATPMEAA